MRDVRLLTLYKQHYLDFYPQKLDCQITCLGYYDGLDIKEVEPRKYSNLFDKETKSPVSDLWYSTGDSISNLKKGCSNQNIGLFRCVSEESRWEITTQFWKEKETIPFWGVGFLRLKDCRKYGDIGSRIELEGEIKGDRGKEEILRVLTYCTYDNADLIVLVQGNSISKIGNFFEQTETRPEVQYMHSIIGISEKYLEACKREDKTVILDSWEGTRCFVEEPVKRVHIQMVTSGDADVLSKLKGEMEECNSGKTLVKGYDKIKFSYMMGHGNIGMFISETDVKSILSLLVPGGFLTHQNHVYGHGLYNIETIICLEEKNWKDIPIALESRSGLERQSWCRKLIEKYQKRMPEVLRKGDDGLYSCYQALVQTLNTLDQYEQFGISQDIFCLLFQAFYMFDEQLEKALEEELSQEYSVRMEGVKKSICYFLECSNSVIYHTIHTDQIYLMIPGSSGTSFSIPIKLNLLYLWFIDRVKRVLNDHNRKYCCILTPVMESRPITELISFGLPERDRLICVRLAQRSLYLPRALMIILAHEMGHYVGDGLRNRKLRFECLIRTMAFYIAEGIIPEEYDGETICKKEIELYTCLKTTMKKSIEKCALDYMNAELACLQLDRAYYADDIENELKNLCIHVLEARGRGSVYEIIWKIPQNVQELSSAESFAEDMRYVYRMQKQFDNNRRILLSSGVLQVIIHELLKVYKEAFSDMVALAILDCENRYFHETFGISEGMGDSLSSKYRQQTMRETLAFQVVFNKTENKETADEEKGKPENPEGDKTKNMCGWRKVCFVRCRIIYGYRIICMNMQQVVIMQLKKE